MERAEVGLAEFTPVAAVVWGVLRGVRMGGLYRGLTDDEGDVGGGDDGVELGEGGRHCCCCLCKMEMLSVFWLNDLVLEL